MIDRSSAPSSLYTKLFAALSALLLAAPGLLAQDNDAPLEPLRIGGSSDQAASIAATMIGGLEVYSLPPGRALVIRFDSKDDLSGLDQLYTRVNDAEFRTTPEQYVRLQNDGLYKIAYYTIDRAGNKSPVQYRHLLIDSTAPHIRHQVVDSRMTKSGAVGKDARLAIGGSDAGTGLAEIQWRPGQDGTWQTYANPIGLAQYADAGRGIIQYKARDRVGNESPVTLVDFTVDTSAPPIPQILDETAGDPILLDKDGLKVPPTEPGSTLEYKLDDGTWVPVKQGDRIPLPESGDHTITFRVTDELGNSQEKSYRIKVDVKAPQSEIQAVP